jgi:hypothetical protein
MMNNIQLELDPTESQVLFLGKIFCRLIINSLLKPIKIAIGITAAVESDPDSDFDPNDID